MKKFKWTIWSVVLTPILMLLGVLLAGIIQAHEPMIFLFPWAAATHYFGNWKLPFIVLAIVQTPIYGLIIDLHKKRFKVQYIAIPLVLLHITIATLVYVFRPDQLR